MRTRRNRRRNISRGRAWRMSGGAAAKANYRTAAHLRLDVTTKLKDTTLKKVAIQANASLRKQKLPTLKINDMV